MTNQQTSLPDVFKALGDPTRLEIFRFLASYCCGVAVDDSGGIAPLIGPTVGEVCCRINGVERANSRISFHLKELRNAGLITTVRRGKHIICSVNRDAVRLLADYFKTLSENEPEACCE